MRRAKWILIGRTLLPGLLVGLLAGSAALAAGPDVPIPPAGAPAGPPPLPSEQIEAQLAYLRTALQITPDQAGPWNKVADVLRTMAHHHDARILAMWASLDGGATRPPDLIEALEHRQSGLAEESRDLADLIAAAKPLYASLSADQKKMADRLPRTMGGLIVMARPPLPGLERLPPAGLQMPE